MAESSDLVQRRRGYIERQIALNRGDEFKMHVRAALQHGMDPDLIKEVILQSAIYCGIPAANTALHQAGEIIQETAAR